MRNPVFVAWPGGGGWPIPFVLYDVRVLLEAVCVRWERPSTTTTRRSTCRAWRMPHVRASFEQGGGEGGRGFWTQNLVYQKWPDQIFPIVNFGFSHYGHFGLGRGGGGFGGGPPPLLVLNYSKEALPHVQSHGRTGMQNFGNTHPNAAPVAVGRDLTWRQERKTQPVSLSWPPCNSHLIPSPGLLVKGWWVGGSRGEWVGCAGLPPPPPGGAKLVKGALPIPLEPGGRGVGPIAHGCSLHFSAAASNPPPPLGLGNHPI